MSHSKNSPKVYVIRSPFSKGGFSVHHHTFGTFILVGRKLGWGMIVYSAHLAGVLKSPKEMTALQAYLDARPDLAENAYA